MSLAIQGNIRKGIWILWVALIVVSAAPVDAAVSVYPQDAVDTPESVLTTRIITEDGEPIGSAWQAIGGQSTGNTNLNPDGHLAGDGEPSLVVHPQTGLAIAVWAQSGPGGFDIVLSRFAAGSWTAPEVLVGSIADELDPFLLVDPTDGDVHLLYWVHDAGPRVMHQQAPSNLSGWSAAQQVSGFGEIAVRPSAAFVQGTLLVTYERHDLGLGAVPRQIGLATQAGIGFTTESVGTTYESTPNWPEVHARDGRLWIDWIHLPDAMAWTIWGPDGWEAMQLEGFAGTEDCTFRVRGRIKVQVLD